MSEANLERRLKIMALVLIVLFAFLTGRLWQLQVVHGERYEQLSEGNRVRFIPTTAPRGRIFDRYGNLLVGNRLSFTVSVVPGGLSGGERGAVLGRLSDLLEMSPDNIEAVLQGTGSGYPYEPRRLHRDIPPELVIAIEENRMDLPGVIIEEEPVRSYPRGDLAGHVLGYQQVVNVEDLVSGHGYRPTDLVGRTGLERVYESTLRGQAGNRQVEVNALSRPVQVLGSVDPVPGNDLVLTLDTRLQAAAQQALVDQLAILAESEDLETPPEAGVVVALDPRSGAVLAMVSYPGFNPNRFLERDLSTYYRSLERDPRNPLLNRIVSASYEPGSAFKPVTALAILQQGVIRPDELFYADGYTQVGNEVKVDWMIRRGLPAPGYIDLPAALEQSSNDYFWTLGAEAGIESIAAMAREFGLGSPTGLTFSPRERAGLVGDPDYKFQIMRERWYRSETMDVSTGQGLLNMTPLQMASVYMGFANRGAIYRPYLVQEVKSPEGEVLARHEPELIREVHAPAAHWDAVHAGLKAAVTGERGTARGAFWNFPVSVAGKTGSAQVGRGEAHGWFAAYAPADNPEIVVASFVEHGGGGASAAAPVARRVLEAYFAEELFPSDGKE